MVLCYSPVREGAERSHVEGAGEMTAWFRALAALPEDPVSVPSTHMVPQLSVTQIPGDPMPSSDLSTPNHAGDMQMYMQAKTEKQINKYLKKQANK